MAIDDMMLNDGYVLLEVSKAKGGRLKTMHGVLPEPVQADIERVRFIEHTTDRGPLRVVVDAHQPDGRTYKIYQPAPIKMDYL